DENQIRGGNHLSISNDIKTLLDIQDENIIFEENGVYTKYYKGSMSKFVTAKLTYIPTHSEKCGVKNDDFTIYKNGTKTSHIKLPMLGQRPETSVVGELLSYSKDLKQAYDCIFRRKHLKVK